MIRLPPRPPLFPYTTLFRSVRNVPSAQGDVGLVRTAVERLDPGPRVGDPVEAVRRRSPWTVVLVVGAARRLASAAGQADGQRERCERCPGAESPVADSHVCTSAR